MEIAQNLQFRGICEHATKEGKKYYTYYFEDKNGISVSFNNTQLLNFQKGKNYVILFNVTKMYYKGISTNE